MYSKRHEVVHGIVRGCHIAEDSRDCNVTQSAQLTSSQTSLGSILPLASFSASATVSNPKCVVFSLFVECGCGGESALRTLLEKHRLSCDGCKCGLAARRNGRMADLDTIGGVVCAEDRKFVVLLTAVSLEVVMDIFSASFCLRLIG